MKATLDYLAKRIGTEHPLYGVAEQAALDHPEDLVQIVLAAADWAAYAEVHDRDPFSLGAEDFDEIFNRSSDDLRYARRRGLQALWDVIDPAGERAAIIATLRPCGKSAAVARRLTPDERGRVTADAIRDLRRGALRVTAARDLLAIGLLGAGVASLDGLTTLERSHLADGWVTTTEGELRAGDDVAMPARILEALLEREIGPLRPADALVPTVGERYLRAYRRDDRSDMLPAVPAYLRACLGRRLRRAGLDIPWAGRRWAGPSWFVGAGDGSFRLPPDLAMTLLKRRPAGDWAATSANTQVPEPDTAELGQDEPRPLSVPQGPRWSGPAYGGGRSTAGTEEAT